MLHVKLKRMEHRATCKHVFCSVPGVWLKGQNIFFLKKVMLHIKLKGMECRAPCKHIFCPYKHPQPVWGRVKRSKHFFLNVVMLHIKLNYRERSVDQHRSKNFNLTHTPDLWMGSKGHILKLYRKVYFIIELL